MSRKELRRVRILGEPADDDRNYLYFHGWASLSEKPLAICETGLGTIKLIEHDKIWIVDE